MSYKEKMSNNLAQVAGTIVEPLTYSHSYYGEKFYQTKLAIMRQSETYDIIPLIISERSLINTSVEVESNVFVHGEFRSRNIDSKLHLFIWTKTIEVLNEKLNINELTLTGTICKEPIYRYTPLGRQITDLLVAVNRVNNKSDYLPLVIWSRNALFAASLTIGDKIKIGGRIQSREYFKRISSTDQTDAVVKKVAYEVSARYIELLNEE